MDWIDVKDQYPADKQHIRIRIFDYLEGCDCEVNAIFNDYEDYRSWSISEDDLCGRKLTARPSHWIPVPLPPVSQ